MILKPVTSEKAVKLIDTQNTLLFQVERQNTKAEIQKEVETIFSVKVRGVRTLVHQNKKFAYVKLDTKYPAIDIATKVGMM